MNAKPYVDHFIWFCVGLGSLQIAIWSFQGILWILFWSGGDELIQSLRTSHYPYWVPGALFAAIALMGVGYWLVRLYLPSPKPRI